MTDEIDPRNDPEGYDGTELRQRYLIREVLDAPGYVRAYNLRQTVLPETYTLSDEPVERIASMILDNTTQRYHHGVDNHYDQLYCDFVAQQMQEACRWFYDPEWESRPFPGVTARTPFHGVSDIRLTDAQVRESIRRLDLGENKREAEATRSDTLPNGDIVPGQSRVHERFVLTDLPWARPPALVERLYAIRAEFGFQKLGPVASNYVTEKQREYEAEYDMSSVED